MSEDVTRGGRGAPKTRAFLAAIREMPNITVAAKAAGIRRELHHRRLKVDPVYKAAFEDAWEIGVQSFEDKATRRAQWGSLKPKFYKGRRVALVREYSDALTMFLLRGARPDKYRDRTELSGAVTVNLVERLSAGRQRVANARTGNNSENA